MTSEQLIKNSLSCLHNNGLIAFSSETGWQLACNAMDESAVDRLKRNSASSQVSVLMASNRDILLYVAAPDPAVFDFLDIIDNPTTIIFENGIGLADNLLNVDGSIAIRIVQDEFTRHLIKRFGNPLAVVDLSYSTNLISSNINKIDPNWYNLCDYLMENAGGQLPSKTGSWVKWTDGPTPIVIRP